MNDEDKVRYRNDGEDFHLLWTARRALKLLDPSSNLEAIAVEGISKLENKGRAISGGILGIDTALYYGSEEFLLTDKIEYCQLKYSTTSSSKPWSAKEIAEVISYFGERYLELVDEYSKKAVHERVKFQFVTNRPISANVIKALSEPAAKNKHVSNARKALLEASGTGRRFSSFVKLVELSGRNPNRYAQSNLLGESICGFTTSNDLDVELRLKDLVQSKTFSDSKDDPVIREPELLVKLGTDLESLLPAPSIIEYRDAYFAREQEPCLVNYITSDSKLTVLHAEGGIGKSVVVSRLPRLLPQYYHCVTFDGFGGGAYRQETSPRHRFNFGLIQIANELVYAGLCDPLIPITGSEDHKIFRKFRTRLQQAVKTLKSSNQQAKLVLVFDAMDNTITGAKLAHEPSFVNAVLNELDVDGIHIVAVARTERLPNLPLPPKYQEVQLEPFTLTESEQHCLATLDAIEPCLVKEFHIFTGGVPRVQSAYLSRVKDKKALTDILRGKRKTADELIADEVSTALLEIKKHSYEPEKIDLLCIALAELPPFIPIHVLALVAGTTESLIRSFVNDLKYPLKVAQNGVQFRDEPVETWFRETFTAEHQFFGELVTTLGEKATTDPYIATSYPRLLFAAKRYEDLVSLALSDDLNFDEPVVQRAVFKSRIEYSLKACLNNGEYDLACKLLLRFSEEVATTERQTRFIQDNFALVAFLSSSSEVADILFRKHKDDWTGIALAKKAAILSPHSALVDKCMQCVAMADAWLEDASTQPTDEWGEQLELYNARDIAALGFALLHVKTVEETVGYLSSWTSNEFQIEVGYELGRLFATQRFSPGELLWQLVQAAKKEPYLLMGLVIALDKNKQLLPEDMAINLAEQLCDLEIERDEYEQWQPVAAIIVMEWLLLYKNQSLFESLLAKYEWPQPVSYFTNESERFSDLEWGMRFFSLKAVNVDVELTEEFIVKKQAEIGRTKQHSDPNSEINHQIKYFGQLCHSRAKLLFAKVNWDEAYDSFIQFLSRVNFDTHQIGRSYYLDANRLPTMVANVIFDVTAKANVDDLSKLEELANKIDNLELYTPPAIKISLARSLSGSVYDEAVGEFVLKLLCDAASQLETYLENANDKAQTYADIASVAYAISIDDANAYLTLAFESLAELDYDSKDMLDACRLLAKEVATDGKPRPKLAYQVARMAEFIHSLNSHKFPWESMIGTVTRLCPVSGLAIASRWRDRRLGWHEDIVATVCNRLNKTNAVESEILAAMEVYGLYWDYGSYFDMLLARCDSDASRIKIVKILENDIQADKKPLSVEQCRQVEKVAKKYKLYELSLAEIVEAQTYDKINRKRSENYRVTDSKESCELPAEIDTLLDTFIPEDKDSLPSLLMAINDIREQSEGQRGFPTYTRMISQQEIFCAIRAKVTLSARKAYFVALPHCDAVDHNDLLDEIEACVQTWQSSPVISNQLNGVVSAFIQSRAVDILWRSYNAEKVIDKLAHLSGKQSSLVFKELLDNVVGNVDCLHASSLYFLVRKISEYFDLSSKEAVLAYALDRLERHCKDDVADGQWRDELVPPEEIDEAVANFIWCGLASPESEIRWRSAHVVRRLCHFEQRTVIKRLFEQLEKGAATAFVDKRLPFYDMHAQMYFLMAIARSAHESPAVLCEFSSVIFAQATQAPPHVFNRQYAKNAALALAEFDQSLFTQEQVALLKMVNVSGYVKIKADPNRHFVRREYGKSDFGFTNDMDKYWLPKLSDVFGVDTQLVEESVAKRIMVDWQGGESSIWNADLRAKYGLYIGETHSRRHEYPETDRHSFYLALHAMAIRAGELLEKYPILQDDYAGARWENWLEHHTASLTSGDWISDRRVGCPLPKREWMNGQLDENWVWQIQNQDFIDILMPKEGKIQLLGDIEFADQHGRTESAAVTSVLVDSDASLALMRRFQFEQNDYDYAIPIVDNLNEEQNFKSGKKMVPFVVYPESNPGIERFDPLAGDIHYPTMSISKDFVERCDLVEYELGKWCFSSKTTECIVSESWGKWHPDKRNRGKDIGQWLIADITQLCQCLAKVGKDLLIEVNLHRHDLRLRDEQNNEYRHYVKIFVLNQDGFLHELNRTTKLS